MRVFRFHTKREFKLISHPREFPLRAARNCAFDVAMNVRKEHLWQITWLIWLIIRESHGELSSEHQDARNKWRFIIALRNMMIYGHWEWYSQFNCIYQYNQRGWTMRFFKYERCYRRPDAIATPTAAREFYFTRVIHQGMFGSAAWRRDLADSHSPLPDQYLKSTTQPQPQPHPWLQRSSPASSVPSPRTPTAAPRALAIRFETRREIILLLHLARGSSSFLIVPPDLIVECESRRSALSSPAYDARGCEEERARADSILPFCPTRACIM